MDETVIPSSLRPSLVTPDNAPDGYVVENAFSHCPAFTPLKFYRDTEHHLKEININPSKFRERLTLFVIYGTQYNCFPPIFFIVI